MRPGMRLGEALATCPELELVEQDPATAEQAWEEILRRLEDAGFAVESADPGTVFFESKGVERLYGGLEPALKRALAAVGTAWDARAGAAERRFAALAAANVARPGQALIVSDDRSRSFLAPLPLKLLPLERGRYEELEELGSSHDRTACRATGRRRLRTVGAGRTARLEPGERRAGREGVAETAGCRPPRDARVPGSSRQRADAPARARSAARPPARTAGTRGAAAEEGRGLGATRRRRLVAPDGDAARADGRSGPAAGGARAEARRAAGAGAQAAARDGRARRAHRRAARARRRGGRSVLQGRLQEGLRQVRAAVGAGGVSTVVEVAPWSRIPEARALLVPRDD